MLGNFDEGSTRPRCGRCLSYVRNPVVSPSYSFDYIFLNVRTAERSDDRPGPRGTIARRAQDGGSQAEAKAGFEAWTPRPAVHEMTDSESNSSRASRVNWTLKPGCTVRIASRSPRKRWRKSLREFGSMSGANWRCKASRRIFIPLGLIL